LLTIWPQIKLCDIPGTAISRPVARRQRCLGCKPLLGYYIRAAALRDELTEALLVS
jgi:hypothetical protein